MNLFKKNQNTKSSSQSLIFYGAHWCGDCRRALKFLNDNRVQYKFVDVDRDKDAEAFIKKVNHGMRSIPTIVFPDGSILVEPNNSELGEKLQSVPSAP